jgi:anti-anti-sigma factor
MEIRISIADKVARMSLGGRFDFSAHRNFRDASEQLLTQDEVDMLDLDLAAVSYLDSSALGMLLMLRDKARAARREVRLSHCSQPVRQVLEIANFGKLFRID